MSDCARLERGYRRLLACYPREFRRENEDEILGVLMATSAEDQERVGLGEANPFLFFAGGGHQHAEDLVFVLAPEFPRIAGQQPTITTL